MTGALAVAEAGAGAVAAVGATAAGAGGAGSAANADEAKEGIDSSHAALRDFDRRIIRSPPLKKRTDRPPSAAWAIFLVLNHLLLASVLTKV